MVEFGLFFLVWVVPRSRSNSPPGRDISLVGASGAVNGLGVLHISVNHYARLPIYVWVKFGNIMLYVCMCFVYCVL